jgi:single-strand selective monofunctional uracil DNA glycosylase
VTGVADSPSHPETFAALRKASRALARRAGRLSFGPPVAFTVNPLVHARVPHERYLALARPGIDALFLGMNPGPFGMVQTGVPFGEVDAVRRFLRIDGPVTAATSHPKRPIEGFACRRSEVSGRRFWGLMEAAFGTRERFVAKAFVHNWCPLAFMGESGANLTPDALPVAERGELAEACDEALRAVVAALRPRMVIGVGGFATACAGRALRDSPPELATILHPSPASPAANRGWEAQARTQLAACGFPLPA